MDIREMREELIEELEVQIAEDDGTIISQLIRGGFKGYDNMTAEEIEDAYKKELLQYTIEEINQVYGPGFAEALTVEEIFKLNKEIGGEL